MSINHQLSEIFNLFHDGTIESYKVYNENLLLKIECSYLADVINKSFNYFFLELIDLSQIELEIFRQSDSTKLKTLNDCNEIFNLEIQIYSSEIIDDIVNINCWQINDAKYYCGNNLKIKCEDIQIYTEEMNKITIKELSKVSERYWSNL